MNSGALLLKAHVSPQNVSITLRTSSPTCRMVARTYSK
nr:MAG: hypothetical protein [Molluscum contagiosum virus]